MYGKSIISEAFVYAAGSVIVQSCNFAGLLLLMRYIDVESFGLYSFIIEFVGIFTFVLTGWVAQYVTRLMCKNELKTEKIYKTSQLAQLYLVCMMFLVTIGTAFFSNIKYYNFVIIQAFGSAINASLSPVTAQLVASRQKNIVFFRDILCAVGKFCFIVYGVYAEKHLSYFFYAESLAFLLNISFVFFYKKTTGCSYLLKVNTDFASVRGYLQEGLPLVLLMTGNILFNKIDVLMLEGMKGSFEVGIYAGAARFIYPFMFISSVFITVIFPWFVRGYSSDNGGMATERLVKISFLFMSLIGALLSFVLFVSSDLIFSTFQNDKYENSITVYKILVWYLAIVFPCGILTNNFMSLGKTQLLIGLNFSMAILNVVINIVLIPEYGAVGAAISTIFCEILILIVALICQKNLKTL